MTREEKLQRLRQLQDESAALARSIEVETGLRKDDEGWPPKSFYWMYHLTTGQLLGSFGAIVSLMFNVVGSVLFDKNPFELIRVFLTFPMGAGALTSDSDVALLIGIILYVFTGALYGVVFELIMYRYFRNAARATRLGVAIFIGLGIWLVNFYGILSWLQPLLFDGSWILEMIPWWVAALTHIVFALTMVFIGEWGHFEATDYRRQVMVHNEDQV
jgi:hypothetical protein